MANARLQNGSLYTTVGARSLSKAIFQDCSSVHTMPRSQLWLMDPAKRRSGSQNGIPAAWVACYGLSNQFTDRALKASGWMLQKMVMYTLCCALCRMEIVLARNGMSLRPPISIPSNYLRPISIPSNYQKSQQRQQGLAGKSVRYAQAQDLWTSGFVAARRSTRPMHSFHFNHWSNEFHSCRLIHSFIRSFIHSFIS